MQVWVLMKGENHEGGDLIGLYWTKDDAYEDFCAEAAYIHSSFGISSAWTEKEDGAVHLQGGCDWLSLIPQAVKGSLPVGIAARAALAPAQGALPA